LTHTWGISPKKQLFGPNIDKGDDYFDINSYFSELLNWDDEHCYALQASIHDAQITRGNDIKDKLYGLIWIAAEQWIDEHRENHIYCRFPSLTLTDAINHEKYECS
jgi:hypothetical protein